MTSAEIRSKVYELMQQYRIPLVVEFSGAPRRPRVSVVTPSGGLRDLSPRCSKREMKLWLDGLEEGLLWMYENTTHGGV